MTNAITLLELIQAVDEHSRCERETIATIVHLVNSGRVRLGGSFRGAIFDLDVAASAAA
jgi:hypothetical protein